ncbi:MAG: glucoamylase family protein [Reichenbachiella sp.]|uniref:glucoamylase family protein n=1 Tax=Reichenbachiella sp. TaxID=2184521 RepID=UPI003265BC7E
MKIVFLKFMILLSGLMIALLSILLTDCTGRSSGSESIESTESKSLNISDDSLLTLVQYQTFQYFWDGAEPTFGLARERVHMDNIYPAHDKNIVTSGGTGFGLMAILVGVERGFITREQAFERFKKIVDFLENADRFHGVFPHWWQGETGKAIAFSKKDDGGDLVETAFLAQGLLTVRQYFQFGDAKEKELVKRIDKIWKEIEWNWHTKNGENVLYWHWSPNFGWDMNFPVGGYNEALIMYVLAASSPTYGIEPEVYHEGWARKGAIETDETYQGYDLVLDHYEHDGSKVGPLFWAHYSYLGLNPTTLKDQYGEYWILNQSQVGVHYDHCVNNPNGYKGYSKDNWGLTSSYSVKGYKSHRPDQDVGVISPTAALSSFPYSPKESMDMLKFLYAPDQDSLIGKYGPYDAYSFEHSWHLPRYLAIDQGPIPVMIENHRTGLLWKLFMSCPEVQQGLDKLGFTY